MKRLTYTHVCTQKHAFLKTMRFCTFLSNWSLSNISLLSTTEDRLNSQC